MSVTKTLEETIPKVAVCIPTYNAESFIRRTLACARNQTHQNLQILVSVDVSDDQTAQICLEEAGSDDRIEVFIQDHRLGWSQNANVVLNAVQCDYFFLYFHDDIIEPNYVEDLLQALLQQPEAASAHCDLQDFGLLDDLKPAHAYVGTTVNRLVEFMMTQKGTTLRSLVRSAKQKYPLRFPNIPGDNHWTAYVFHLHLLALGPALAYPQVLYKRWQRPRSLTSSEGWLDKDLAALLRGQQESIRASVEIIQRYLPSEVERHLAMYCLKLFQFIFIRSQQIRLQSRENISQALHGHLDLSGVDIDFQPLSKDILADVVQAEKKLKEIEKMISLLPLPLEENRKS